MKLARRFWSEARTRSARSFREFAEEEIVLPVGPFAGRHFSCDVAPYTGLVLDEFERRRQGLSHFNEFWGSGPVQTAKTLVFGNIPLLFHLFEQPENVIIGGPSIELVRAVWKDKLRPVIEASQYARLLPKQGRGSKGGDFEDIRFDDGGPTLRLVGGGRPQQQSSHTFRIVILTEVDKFDEPGEGSREIDPVSLIIKRTRAFADRRLVYAECTMSTKQGRIWREIMEIGTGTTLRFRCPLCGRYVACERPGLIGWQGARDEFEARENARFVCPACKGQWREADRKAALRSPLFVARGQDVGADGALVGDPPRTSKFGLAWNGMASPLTSIEEIAAHEWEADHTNDPQKKKAVVQDDWALPWEEESLNFGTDLKRDQVLAKIVGLERGAVPAGTSRLVATLDIGGEFCWWAALAFTTDAQCHIADYGKVIVPDGPTTRGARIMAALRAFRDQFLAAGWGGVKPFLTVWDSGWEPDIVYAIVRESGQPRHLASKGFGTNYRKHGAWTVPTAGDKEVAMNYRVAPQPNGVQLFEIHADFWKRKAHEGLAAAPGTPGSITIFKGTPEAHAPLVRQLLAEHEEQRFDTKKGQMIVKWVQTYVMNHWLDCLSNGLAGAHLCGIRWDALPSPPKHPPRRGPEPTRYPPTRRPGAIRTRY